MSHADATPAATRQFRAATGLLGAATGLLRGATVLLRGATEQSGGATEQSGGATEQPGRATEQPGRATEQPGRATEQPGRATEQSGGATNPSGLATHLFRSPADASPDATGPASAAAAGPSGLASPLNAKLVVFINPPYERIAPGYGFVKHITNRSPSLGLLHLAAEVRQHGYDPTILESDILDLDAAAVAERVIAMRPAYVGITLFTVGVAGSVEICRRIRAALPDCRIIVGGPHISSMGPDTIARFGVFDVAVQGEGEKILVNLLRAFDDGADLADVHGIIYRDERGVRVNPADKTENVLDDLPFPAWDLLPNFPRAYPLAIYDYPVGPVATIAASRGCPFHCKFCDTSTFGARVRYYSPEKVVEMMEHLRDRYGVRHVLFVDDLFLASRLRTTKFCELVIERGIQMTWSCAARVDTVRPDLLALMKRAGCWQISFGLETGSEEMLKKMDKVARVERSEAAVKETSEAGIRVKGLFMLGYPGETEASIEETKEFVSRIPMTIMNLTKFTPYPGSPVYRELYGTNIREDHWSKMNGMNFVWTPDGIDANALDRHYQDILAGFYKRKPVRRQYIHLSVRHPEHLRRLARFGAGFVWAKTRSVLGGRKGLLNRTDLEDLDVLPEPALPVRHAPSECATPSGPTETAVTLTVRKRPSD